MKFVLFIFAALLSQSASAAITIDPSNSRLVHVTDTEAETLIANLGQKAKALRCERIPFGMGGYVCYSENVQVTGDEGRDVFKVYAQAERLHWEAERLSAGDMVHADMVCTDEVTCILKFRGMGGAL